MKAYEYFAKVSSDGHLTIPEKLKGKLKADSEVRVMILVEDEDTEWNKFAMSQFLKGYSEEDAIYDHL